MWRRAGLTLLLLTLWSAGPARAVQPDEVLPDPALESRARAISHELRCMVCQNQSIDDSEAPLAKDLRVLVRERLKAGDSDREVIDFMVARYGEFVLLKPRLAWHTAMLWAAPLVALIAGLVMIWRQMRRRSRGFVEEATGLTELERSKLAAIEPPQEVARSQG